MHREDVGREGLVVGEAARHVERVVEGHQPRRRARLEAVLAHRGVVTGVRRSEERAIDGARTSLDAPTVPGHALVVGSDSLVALLFPGLLAGLGGAVGRIDVVRDEALQRGTGDDRDAPGVVHREADVDRARVAVSDEQAAREGELGESVSGGREARLPTLKAARVVGRHSEFGELLEPRASVVVADLAVGDFRGGPRVVSEAKMVWDLAADRISQDLPHRQVSSKVACTARLSQVATCSSSRVAIM